MLIIAEQPARCEAAREARVALPPGRFRRSAHVDQVEHAGSIILFDKRAYYTLSNDTATDLWALLAEPRTAQELVAAIYDVYDAPREVVAGDVAAQLAHLRARGLVMEIGPTNEPVLVTRPWWRPWRRRS